MRSEAEVRGRLAPRVHTEYGGTPYFDEELQVAQSAAHRIMVAESAPVLAAVAEEAGLTFLSDEPIWYLHPESDEQKAYYGDLVLGRAVERGRITAADLLLVIEAVSTNDRRKELKDTRFQPLLNEYNHVPELALVFPEMDDARALTFYRLVDGQYTEQVIVPGGCAESAAVPGLSLRVLPRERWSAGYKLDVFYRGELRPRLAAERRRAEQEKQRAEQEKQRADRLAERLRALGVDPEG